MRNILRNSSKKKHAGKLSQHTRQHQNSVVNEVEKPINGSFDMIMPKTPSKDPKKKIPKKILILFAVLVIIVGFTLLVSIIPARAVYNNSKKLTVSGRELSQALKNQDLEAAQDKLPEVKQSAEDILNSWNQLYVLRYLPILRTYHQDGVHAFVSVTAGLDAMEIAIESVEPYADLLGLKAGSSFVAGSADERIQLAVKTMDKLTPKLKEIGEKINIINQEIEQINPQRYPQSIGGRSIRPRLVEGKRLIQDTTTLFLNAQPLLEELPDILGNDEEKRYIVIFQNDAELRPTGGFITAYAIFKVNQGRFIVEKSEDIYELDDRISSKEQAPDSILTYHKGVYYYNIRDSNLSPDFVNSMKEFIRLYPDEKNFDGIIAVDTHVLVEAIKILGEFNIAGRKFSSEIDERCDCPKVIYELEDYATRPVAYVKEARKDILGVLLLEIMKKALGVSPSQYWGSLFQMGLSEIDQKHILAFMLDEKAQQGVESLNMAGRIAEGVGILGYKDGENWDYLHINDANMAGAKSNLFVQHQVAVDYQVDEDDNIIKTITIDYKNPAEPSDCNLESGGLCLNGLLRNWIRVYVPLGSELLETKGSQNPKDDSAEDMLVDEDLDKTIFEGFLTVRPLGAAQLTMKYQLPFKKTKESLPVLIQKQPGTDGHKYVISVNGKQKEVFNLINDQKFDIKL